MKRKLTLKKESLVELSAAELTSVAGGEAPYASLVVADCGITQPPAYCLTLAGSRCIY